MGTRRMWLFLLLAAIQYAGVRATTPTACEAAPKPTPECASFRPVPNCEVPTGPPNQACSSGKKWMFKERAKDPWRELASITCDTAKNVWKATEIAPSGKTYDLGVGDTLVCAISPPPTPPCAECLPLSPADCKTEEGCVKGGDPVGSVDPYTKCKQLKCPPGQFFGTNLPPAAVAEVQITCDSATKWKTAVGNKEVAKAVCVKEYQCHLKSKLISSCAGPKLVASGCDAIDQTKLIPTCPVGKKLFYKKGAAALWVASTGNNKLTCNAKTTGLWTIDGTTVNLEKGDHAICAKKNPDSIKLCTTQLTSECGATVNTKAVCSTLALIPLPKDDTPIACPTATPQPRLYRYDTALNKWNEANIHCELSSGEWMDGTAVVTTNVVCAAANPTRRLCSTGAVAIKSECKVVLNNDCESVPLQDNTPLACPSQPVLYFKKATGGDWEDAKKVVCDDATGEWKQGDDPTQLYTMLANDQVLCAGSKPIDKCSENNPLKTECSPGFTGCSQVEFDDNLVPKACADPNQMHFRHGFEKWTKTAGISCDAAGKWATAEVGTNLPVKNDIVICFEGDPNANVCTLPTSTCPPTSTTCEQPTVEPLACPTGKNFYFKKESGHKWMKAEAIGCTGGKLQATYKYGGKTKTAEDLPDDAEIICDATNPDKDVCSFTTVPLERDSIFIVENPPSNPKFEAGKVGECASDRHVFRSESKSEVGMTFNSPPVCKPDGNWAGWDDDRWVDVGKKVACIVRKCKKCLSTPSDLDIAITTITGLDSDNPINHGGDCSMLKCSADNKFVVKTTDKIDGFEYFFTDYVECSADSKWSLKGKTEVGQAKCVQRVYCLADHFAQVTYKCPEAPDPIIPGCVPPTSEAEGGRDAGEPNNVLKCPDTKKMLIRHNSVDWWDEIQGHKIKCEEARAHKQSGQWEMKIVGSDNVEYRDYNHTILCLDSNPKLKPTTTTTTTTPAPIFPICEVCNNSRPEGMDGCDKCDGTKIKLTPNSADDECTMNPISKDYKLVINSMEEVAAIVCKRDTQQWTKAGGTGEPITKVSARQETKREAWKMLSYVIVAVVFVAIGGMGIICVVIFMRMRKKLSEREGNKKERGVTKKYNASSVVKTKGNKANTKSEAAGKSVEAAKSKTEENLEDAPTLKL